MRIEAVTQRHLAEIAAIEQQCFAEPWSEVALSLLLTDKAFGLAVTEEQTGQVLAYLGVLVALDEGQIINVATHPQWRRCGHADALLAALLCESRARGLATLSLEVRESNTAAIALYQKHGFFVAGKRPRFYRMPTENALVMLCNL